MAKYYNNDLTELMKVSSSSIKEWAITKTSGLSEIAVTPGPNLYTLNALKRLNAKEAAGKYR